MAYEDAAFFDSTPLDERLYTDSNLSRGLRVVARQREGVTMLGSNLRVIPASSGLRVQIEYGSALLRGYPYVLADDGGRVFEVDLTAPVDRERIDRIVLRLNLTTDVRYINAFALSGEESNAPEPPALTRENTIYEMSLARVRLRPGVSSIATADIDDERDDPEVCGTLFESAAELLALLKEVDGAGSGLDADMVDGQHATDFATAEQGARADAALPATQYTAGDVLEKLKTVDGTGSGLDADTLDGASSADFATATQGEKADAAAADVATLKSQMSTANTKITNLQNTGMKLVVRSSAPSADANTIWVKP